MNISLAEITSYLKSQNVPFETYGNDIEVRKMLAFAPSVENALCYLVGSAPPDVSTIRNSIIICEPDTGLAFPESNSLIFTHNPQLCFYRVSSLFEQKQDASIHPQAIIESDAKIGSNVSIGPYCVLETCSIGDNVTIEAGVKIKNGTTIGNNVVIQSNTVIGATGVMWTWDGQGKKVTCAQTGHVVVQDGVFLGSNITIVKGAFENKPTLIGHGTMMSHGTMIGHGVIIGNDCHFANNVSLAGSVIIGNGCFLGSGAIVRPHITIPDGVVVGAGAVVVKNHPAEGVVLAGNPAREIGRAESALAGVPTPHHKSGKKE